MKALSIHQPYARLITLGHKKIETRGHDTSYTGEILIHAATTRLTSAKYLSEKFFSILDPEELSFYGDGTGKNRLKHFDSLPFGAVVGRAVLRGTLPVMELVEKYKGTFVPDGCPEKNCFRLTEKEKLLGNYSYDRFAYFLDCAEPLDKPVPAKGGTGIWDCGEELVARVQLICPRTTA